MPKQEGQKTKLLALLHIFEQKTDENHLLNVPQLVHSDTLRVTCTSYFWLRPYSLMSFSMP